MQDIVCHVQTHRPPRALCLLFSVQNGGGLCCLPVQLTASNDNLLGINFCVREGCKYTCTQWKVLWMAHMCILCCFYNTLACCNILGAVILEKLPLAQVLLPAACFLPLHHPHLRPGRGQTGTLAATILIQSSCNTPWASDCWQASQSVSST